MLLRPCAIFRRSASMIPEFFIPYSTNRASLVESMLDEGRTHDVRRLLDSNQSLFENIYKHIDVGHEALDALSGATAVLSQLRDSFQMSPQVPHSSIWIRAASGDIVGSPLLRETLLSIKKTPSDKLLQAFMSFYTLSKH